eukprot:TRINITY_DN8797_c2_g1_i1.p1 TRINITY_DN8797_c2_g1~~TRINITY_DN8797_c2_g1_i1.p1  ORF type:complete len:1203 (-),score=205.76 TRINITY_DN8797_c2_g1_i1:157-3654(-)
MARLCSAVASANDMSCLLWILGLWKVFFSSARNRRRRKAELFMERFLNEALLILKSWYMVVIIKREETMRVNVKCWQEERQMIEMQKVEMQRWREETRQAFEQASSDKEFMEKCLQAYKEENEVLKNGLEVSRPEVLKSALSKVLNSVFASVMEQTSLQRMCQRQRLMTREYSVLSTFDENGVARLLKLPIDEFLGRWVNFHVMHFKLVATRVLEALARARADESAGLETNISEWTKRDGDIYGDRCRIVRSMQRITNFGESIQDGTALSVLYGALTPRSQGVKSLTPADLWPLDERNEEARASKLCRALDRIFPTAAARCLLQPADILNGNSAVIVTVLATLFLQNPKLPCLRRESLVFDFVGATTSHTDSVGIDGAEAIDVSAPMEDEEFEWDEQEKANTLALIGSIEKVAYGCACDSLQDISLLSYPNETARDLLALPAPDILLRWLNYQLSRQDLDPVAVLSDVRSSQVVLEMMQIVASDVLSLLPEGRLLLQAGKKTSTFAYKLVSQVIVKAGSRCTSFPIMTQEALDEGHVDTIVAFIANIFLCRPCLAAASGTPLHKALDHIEATIKRGGMYDGDDVSEGRGDSSGVMEDEFAEGSTNESRLAELCSWYRNTADECRTALEDIETAKRLHAAIANKMRFFLVDLLAQRAKGSPCFSGEAAILENARGRYILPSSVLRAIVIRETPRSRNEEVENEIKSLDEVISKNLILFKAVFKFYATSTLIATNASGDASNARGSSFGRTSLGRTSGRFSVNALMGNSPSSSRTHGSIAVNQAAEILRSLDHTNVMELRGLTRLGKDCRFHQLDLLPVDMESIYLEVQSAELIKEGGFHNPVDGKIRQRGLDFAGFILALCIASFRAVIDHAKEGEHPLAHVLEKYVWPWSTRLRHNFFYVLAYAPGISPCLQKLQQILQEVFLAYADNPLDDEKDDKGIKIDEGEHSDLDGVETKLGSIGVVTTRRPTQAKGTGLGMPVRLISVDSFGNMLRHAGLLINKLSNSIESIVRGVTTDEDSDGDGSDSESGAGVQVSERTSQSSMVSGKGRTQICFMEFVDALVVCVLYQDPNPFTPFTERFEEFVRCGLLKGLMLHWTVDDNEGVLGARLRGFLDSSQGNREVALMSGSSFSETGPSTPRSMRPDASISGRKRLTKGVDRTQPVNGP